MSSLAFRTGAGPKSIETMNSSPSSACCSLHSAATLMSDACPLIPDTAAGQGLGGAQRVVRRRLPGRHLSPDSYMPEIAQT